mgnify:CR=1 FL=1
MKNKPPVRLELGDSIPLVGKIFEALEGMGYSPLTKVDEDHFIMGLIAKEFNRLFAGTNNRVLINEYLADVCEAVYDDRYYFQLSYSHRKDMHLIRHEYTWKYHNQGINRFELYDNGKKIWHYSIKNMMCPSDLPFHAKRYLAKNGVSEGIIEDGYTWDHEKKGY